MHGTGAPCAFVGLSIFIPMHGTGAPCAFVWLASCELLLTPALMAVLAVLIE
jgi:hypothetical protein